MKIKVIDKPFEEVSRLPAYRTPRPVKQTAFWRMIMKLVSASELKKTNYTFTTEGMDKIPAGQPCLYLMNHSSFTDLSIAATYLSGQQYHIVCTDDGFIGKNYLMHHIGGIPTKKFITDITLVQNLIYAVQKLQSSILMFPEASYSFDGTETPLPASLGKCLKLLKIPVVMIRTQGAFLRDPLYNCLQKRDATVSAKIYCLLTPEEIQKHSVDELNDILKNAFRYDHFKEQFEAGIKVTEPFRADGLERVLYKCPKCGTEHSLVGKGVSIQCRNCLKTYTLEEDGTLSSPEGSEFRFVTDWYQWERDCVRKELTENTYLLDTDVDILMLVDTKAMYRVGSGHLKHTVNGFELTGCNGSLHFTTTPAQSYSLYADYYWYELGDMICIGDTKARYYCFPHATENIDVAKARLATEELYKLSSKK